MHFDSELLTLKTFHHEIMTINNFCHAQNHSCQYRTIRDTYGIMWKKFRIITAYRKCS